MEGLAANRLRALLEAAVVLSSEREPDTVLERIVDVARDVIGARYAALAVWAGNQIQDFITSGLSAREILLIGDLPKGHGLLGAVLAEGKVIRLPRLSDDPRSFGFPPNHPPMESFLGIPVEYKGEILGHLYLTEKRGQREFTDEDELLGVGLAALAATAMKNATWSAAEQRRIAELEQIDRLRRDFLAIASHELAQPTTTAVGYLETLDAQWDALDDERRREFVRRALRQGKELRSRLDTALDVSRAEEGHLSIELAPFDLADALAETVDLLPPEDQRRLDVAARPAPCEGDRRRVVRVIHNLLTNALKYSPAGSRVQVETAPTAAGAELLVRDTGVGFPPEEAERLFERYYRLQPTGPATNPTGIGLGLYLCRQIVEAHGGTICGHSDGIGCGATFRFELPHDGVPAPPAVQKGQKRT